MHHGISHINLACPIHGQRQSLLQHVQPPVPLFWGQPRVNLASHGQQHTFETISLPQEEFNSQYSYPHTEQPPTPELLSDTTDSDRERPVFGTNSPYSGLNDFQAPSPPTDTLAGYWHQVIPDAFSNMTESGADLPADYEEQKTAAINYDPKLDGPNVSTKLPVSDLIEKYAEGHSAYKQKTENLPSAYEAYRRVKGDGQCGWRAILFRLMEIVIESGVPDMFDRLDNHLLSFKAAVHRINEAYGELYEDGLESISEVVKNLKQLPTDQAINSLEQCFQGDSASQILYCTRLIASVEIRTHTENYEFALEKPIEEYCGRDIEGPEEEITEIGLRALSDALLNPLGVRLEVINLHTNPGSIVDVIPYPEPSSPALGGQFTADNPPIVRLFFTPGHYDLIYPRSSANPHQSATQVQFAGGIDFPFSHAIPHSSYDFGLDPQHPLMNHLVFLDPTMCSNEAMVGQMHTQSPSNSSHEGPTQKQTCHRVEPEFDDDDVYFPVSSAMKQTALNPYHRLHPKFRPRQWTPAELNKGLRGIEDP